MCPSKPAFESLFNGINDIIAHIAPPITTVFLLGVFWKKASAKAAQLTLWIGSLLGVVVFSINKLVPGTVLAGIPFMMMAFYLFVACLRIEVLISYVFPVAYTTICERLYRKSPLDLLRGEAWKDIGNYKFLSVLLLCIMIFLYDLITAIVIGTFQLNLKEGFKK